MFLTDRIKDMIVTGAENVYPIEVESALSEHPDVADVAVIGVPDEKWGETVKAVVVRRPGSTLTEDELMDVGPGPDRRLQAAAVGRLRRRAAPQPVRQAAQAGAPRALLVRRPTAATSADADPSRLQQETRRVVADVTARPTLLAAEHRPALLAEGPHALGHVGGAQQHRLPGPLALQRVVQVRRASRR